MMLNWDENYTYRRCCTFKVAGKVGYSILPYGEVRVQIYMGIGMESTNLLQKREEGSMAVYYLLRRDMKRESTRRWLPSYEEISL